eukprot:SAG11_NODE_661_length_7885_cov_8.956974_4_plen_169_part_00
MPLLHSRSSKRRAEFSMGKRYKIKFNSKGEKHKLRITRRVGSGKVMRAAQFWGIFFTAGAIAKWAMQVHTCCYNAPPCVTVSLARACSMQGLAHLPQCTSSTCLDCQSIWWGSVVRARSALLDHIHANHHALPQNWNLLRAASAHAHAPNTEGCQRRRGGHRCSCSRQ